MASSFLAPEGVAARGGGASSVNSSLEVGAKSRAQAQSALCTEPGDSPSGKSQRTDTAPPRAQAQCCPPARPALGRRRGPALFGGARVRLELDELLGHLVITAL